MLTFLVLAALLLAPALAADTGRKPISFDRKDLVPLEQVGIWTSPRVDLGRLQQEDAANLNRKDVPLRIGYPMTVDLSPADSGTWENLEEGGRLWRLRTGSTGALWIVLGFDLFRLQDGGMLWVYDASGKNVQGPFTVADVRDHGELWLPPIAGDTLVVELYWPAKLRSEQPNLHLGTVSHGYKPFGAIGRPSTESFGDSGACNVDVLCPLGASWQDEKRGVVILLSGGSGFCTGSLVNTTANDCRPYVLTAHHCGAGASLTIGFNFERPGCNSGTPPPETTQTLTGATVLGDFASSDFTLLRMNSSPPEAFGAYFNGWSAEAQPATHTIVIHHPEGDAKKISRDDQPTIDGSDFGPNHWRVQNYEEGTTEPGSSGSPLFDQNSRIVGQLHGGTASCSSITYDEYGKVAVSWVGGGTPASRLSVWLDPVPTGALVMDGVDQQICLFQPAGVVNLVRDAYACSDTLSITLRDDNLRGNATQNVTVASPTEPGGETVTLTVTAPGAGTFAGTFPISTAAPAGGDGQLSVSAGDTVTVTYQDADHGSGQPAAVTDTAFVDCVAPVITNVQSSNVTGNSADVTWTTNEPANSRVHYGLAPPGALMASSATLVVSHSLPLTGLAECSTYYFWVDSTDSSGNLASADNAGAYYTFQTGKNVSPTYAYAGVPVGIPDNTASGASVTVSVPDVNVVQDVNVKVNITHSYDGDLTLSLIGPDATTVVLSNRRGTSGHDFANTVFDDSAATPIASGASPFTGSFQPDALLSAFNGHASAGTWTLKVVDSAGVDTGTINGFELNLSYPPQACGPSLKYLSSTATDACNGTGTGGGNAIVEPGESVTLPITLQNNGTSGVSSVSAVLTTSTPGVTIGASASAYPDLAAGQSAAGATPFTFDVAGSVPCGTFIQLHVAATANQGAWGDNFTIRVGAPGSGSHSYASTDVPKTIADNTTVTSNLVVADVATVTDVNASLAITHTYDNDLLLTLIGPNNTRVLLSNRRGGSSDNFTGTVFDDEAATPISSGTAPFTGSFRPDAPLSAFDGISTAGTWKLEVQDLAGGDTGALTAWSLAFTTTAPDVCNVCTVTAPPGEVASLSWGAKDTIAWTAASGATYYYVYRGVPADMAKLLDATADSCERYGTASLTTSAILEIPLPFEFRWYLVRGSNGAGLGPSGNATVGPRTQNTTGVCP